jgi:small subunit ribosomal protein S4
VLERQFRRHFDAAQRMKGVTGSNLLQVLERRLDNVVYRLGMGSSRKQARQLVVHRHFEVNGKTVNVPSYNLKPGDIVRARANGDAPIDVAADASKIRTIPSWLSYNEDEKSGKVLALPERGEMEMGVEEHLIVEFYSR